MQFPFLGLGSKSVVGLDIGSSSVKAVEVKSKGDGFDLIGLGIAPLPAEAIVDGAFLNSSAIVDAISEACSMGGIKGKNAAAAVSGLKPGAKFQYPIVLIQSSDVNDFEASLNAAEDFYKNELGGISLKQSSTVDYQSTSAAEIPKAFQLNQNFPNPFNPETQIQFDLPKAARVELHIYNTLGQAVRTLAKNDYPAGTFSVTWNGRDNSGRQLPSGMYIYRIKAGDFQAQRKLLFLK